MAERFMYAASLGFSIVIVWLVFKIHKKDPTAFKWKSPDYFKTRNVILGIVLIFTVRSFLRNEDWKDKETLYGNDMQFLTESAKANMLYGALLSRDAMQDNLESRDSRTGELANQAEADSSKYLFKEARKYYRKATEIAPYYHTAWSNLGTTYFFTDDPKGALPYFRKAVSINADYAEGWFNMGMAYDKLQRKDSAVIAFSRCIKSDSTYVAGYEQLSRVRMQEENNPEAALALLRTAARKKPDSEVPWNNMEKIYIQLKDTADAAAAMEMAAQINPSNTQRLYNLAQYYNKHGDYIKARQYDGMLQEEQSKQEKLQREKREQQ